MIYLFKMGNFKSEKNTKITKFIYYLKFEFDWQISVIYVLSLKGSYSLHCVEK